MKKIKIEKNRGFTLIELLVVISIIAFISSVIDVAYVNAKIKTRDVRRTSELHHIQIALDVYFSTYGVYPCGLIFNGVGPKNYDISYSKDFLDGTAGVTSGIPDCPSYPNTGLRTEGLYTVPNDEIFIPKVYFPPIINVYEIDNADRSKYILYTHLESNPSLMQKDGGLCPNLYEVGPDTGIIQPNFISYFGGC